MNGEARCADHDSQCAPYGIACRFVRIACTKPDAVTSNGLAWAEPPRHVTASRHYVDLWLAQLDSADRVVPPLTPELSQEERARAERFRFAIDRRRFVSRRAWLRRLLAVYVDMWPGELVFDRSLLGKPFLKTPATSQVSFSLSHSYGWAIAAVTAVRNLGVDIESLARCASSDALPITRLCGAEQGDLAALPPRLRRETFLTGWTCTEAISKATGLGLDLCTHRFRLSNRGRVCNFVFAGRRWQTLQFVPQPGTVAALVVEQ